MKHRKTLGFGSDAAESAALTVADSRATERFSCSTKQLSCIPFRFSCGGLRKGLLTFGTRVKRPFAQSAARHPKIAQSHKSCNNAPKFQLFPGSCLTEF